MTNDTHLCPIYAKPFQPEDICASDITEGTCHAACLEGSPVVDLETGDELPGGEFSTYRYSEVMDPELETHVEARTLAPGIVGENKDEQRTNNHAHAWRLGPFNCNSRFPSASESNKSHRPDQLEAAPQADEDRLLQPESGAIRNVAKHRSVFVSDFEVLPIYRVGGQNLLREYLPSGLNGLIVGVVERGELSSFRISLEGAMAASMEIIPGHIVSIRVVDPNPEGERVFPLPSAASREVSHDPS
jgi:hypothetical protein